MDERKEMRAAAEAAVCTSNECPLYRPATFERDGTEVGKVILQCCEDCPGSCVRVQPLQEEDK